MFFILTGEMIQFDGCIFFSNGLVKNPPTRGNFIGVPLLDLVAAQGGDLVGGKSWAVSMGNLGGPFQNLGVLFFGVHFKPNKLNNLDHLDYICMYFLIRTIIFPCLNL